MKEYQSVCQKECQIECQNRFEYTVHTVYIYIYVQVHLPDGTVCQQLCQHGVAGWGSLEDRFFDL